MSDFKLINSLINPEVVTEAPVEPQPPATGNGEEFKITDATLLSGYRKGGFNYSLDVEYIHPSLQEPLYLTVRAHLEADYDVDDNSFDYSYGSINATHQDVSEIFSSLEWKNIEIPHIADNMDLFKLDAAKVQHITNFIVSSMSSMDEDEIAKHLDIEKLIDLARPEPGYPEPDDY